MSLFKQYLKNIYNIFKSNWKGFLVIGFIYLLIFALIGPSFEPMVYDNLETKLETVITTKTTAEIGQFLIVSFFTLFVITIFITTIHNFFVFILVKGISDNKFHYLKLIKNNFKYIGKLFLFSALKVSVIFLGIFFFLIPGIYFTFIFCFALPIMAKENLSIMESIKKAMAVFKKDWWRNILLIVCLKVIIFAAMIAFSIIKINGIAMIADLFLTTGLAYLLVYNPIKPKQILSQENE
jgi:uncharacterized membrane protein